MKSGAAFYLAPLHLVQALVGLGAIAAFSRLMNAGEFAAYSIAVSASMLAHTLLFTWLEAAAFRFLPRGGEESGAGDHYFTLLAAALAAALALALGAGLALLAFGAEPQTGALVVFAAGAAALRCFIGIARESDRAALAVRAYALREGAYLTVGFGAGVAALLWFDLGAAAPFAGLMAAGLVVLAVDAPMLARRARGGRISQPRALAYVGYGAPLALALAIELVVQTLVRALLALHAGPAAVGAYAAAFGLARPVDIVFMAAGAALSPLLLGAYSAGGPSATRDIARRGAALALAAALPAAVGLALVAAPLSALVVGPAFSASAAQALPWLALAGLASGFNLYYLSEAFQLTRRTGLRALAMLGPAALHVALAAAFAPEYGAQGAAMAAVVAAALGGVVLILLGRRVLALPLPLGQFARIGVATAAMALAVSATPGQRLLADIPAGACAYALVALALNAAGLRTALEGAAARLCMALALRERSHAG